MMQSEQLNQLGVLETVRAVKEGHTTATAIVQARLNSIEACNGRIKAFVAIDPERALAEAAHVDAGAYKNGLLSGVPFAVKDVLDTADYPTRYGSPIYADHRPGVDAACVRRARQQGAVLMGKVATGEFATQTPSEACNPLRVSHTPGGSSSGSAAAVAAGMVPVAFGTQTTGSIVRPAIYCGLVGYKPSFGMIGTAGLKTLSHTQDTIGVITRDVPDAAYFTLGLHSARTASRGIDRPQIALCRSRQWDYISPETHSAIEDLVRRLEASGARVVPIRLPALLEALAIQQPRLFMFEARQNLAHEFETCREGLSPRLQSRLTAADDVSFDEYVSIRQQIQHGQQAFADMMQGFDALLYPAAAGEAEAGHQEAGDPRFGALWSMLHVPTVSFPFSAGPTGLPLGAQLVGTFGADTRVLAAATSVSRLAAQS